MLSFQNTLAKTRKLDSFLIRQSESTSHDTEESSEIRLIDSTDDFLPSTTSHRLLPTTTMISTNRQCFKMAKTRLYVNLDHAPL